MPLALVPPPPPPARRPIPALLGVAHPPSLTPRSPFSATRSPFSTTRFQFSVSRSRFASSTPCHRFLHAPVPCFLIGCGTFGGVHWHTNPLTRRTSQEMHLVDILQRSGYYDPREVCRPALPLLDLTSRYRYLLRSLRCFRCIRVPDPLGCFESYDAKSALQRVLYLSQCEGHDAPVFPLPPSLGPPDDVADHAASLRLHGASGTEALDATDGRASGLVVLVLFTL
ncbi:hypothetical protein B0H11DRAFT_2233196 [Mycena galericulata]|nr:hypothetical protein B0H11DRAFT_2233196 [Mycena galericulata]